MLTAEHRKKIKYLSQYKYLNKEIDRKIKQLEDWKNKIYNISGTLSDMPRSGSRTSIIENGIAAMDEIERLLSDNVFSSNKQVTQEGEICLGKRGKEKNTAER